MSSFLKNKCKINMEKLREYSVIYILHSAGGATVYTASTINIVLFYQIKQYQMYLAVGIFFKLEFSECFQMVIAQLCFCSVNVNRCCMTCAVSVCSHLEFLCRCPGECLDGEAAGQCA